MGLQELAQMHREASPVVAQKPLQAIMLWYADLDVNLEQRINYRCPSCGVSLTMSLEEFVEKDSNEDLRCQECRGELEERGGPMA